MSYGFGISAYTNSPANSYGYIGPAVSGGYGVSAERVSGQISGSTVGNTSSPGECQTCKSRKYQDGSNEMVSFKSAAHISPEAAGTVVRAHEQEHVSNAYKKAATGDGKVLRASVSIHTSICPECGRSYVSGGTTTTAIKYNKDPYSQNTKSLQAEATQGQNIDFKL